MPSTIRTRVGLIKTLNLTGVPDHTELHGLQHWQCYRNPVDGGATGIYEVSGGEIVSVGNVSYALALWGDPVVNKPGHCVRAEVMSPSWTTLTPGLAANGMLDHSEVTIGVFYDAIEFRHRDIIGDYGSGFPITSGPTPGNPLTNGVYYDLLLAAVQNPGGGFHNRGGMGYNAHEIVMFDSNLGTGTGLNDGTLTYPGLVFWNNAGIHWRNYRVYYDYRIAVNGLSGTQAFRVYDASDAVLYSSPVQSGTQAHVNVHDRTWPFTGYIKVFTDTTWATEVTGGRFPTTGTDANLVGGDVFALSTAGPGIHWNYNDVDEFPDEWFTPADKDVTLDCIEFDILQMAANPNIQVDTATFILRDPTGKYVPARTQSEWYPNIRLGRRIRAVFAEPEGTACRFYGKIASLKPRLIELNSETPEQAIEIRAESPMREIASSEAQLVFPFIGPLVNPDGSGVISSILDLIANIIPLEVRELDPTPDVIPEGFLTVGMTVQTALEQCAIYSDSLYAIAPHWKVSPEEVNFFFVWTSRDAILGQTADHDWVDVDDEIDEMTPDYSADVL
jgi:hypothetical protein